MKANSTYKEPPEESKRLYTGPGQATARDEGGDRPIRYVINWESSQLDYTLSEGASGGKLSKVEGQLYRDGKPASRFSADGAIADRPNKRLHLEGHVIVIGISPKGRLDCQKLEWKTDEKLLKATGKVTLRGEAGIIGPIDELWCLPDLKQAGTPGFYQP